ncbi:hypothetical protein GPN2_13290 [Streptomyces murinus]
MFQVPMTVSPGRFVRVEARRGAGVFVLGLLSDRPRMHCWTLAEQAGNANPYGLQPLRSRAKSDARPSRSTIATTSPCSGPENRRPHPG